MDAAGTLILSPHSDDAVLSLGATIAAATLTPPVTVVTVFGRSSFTQQTGPDGDRERVTALRRAEDEAYAQRRGLTLVWLDHDEALLRVGWRSIFRKHHSNIAARAEILAAARAIPARLVLAPLGLGDHADHVLLAALAAEIAGETPLAYYEDLPYAAKLNARAIAASAAAIDPALTPVELAAGPQHFETKFADAELYRSQMAPWILRALRRHARQGCERVWTRSPTALPA